MNDLGYLKGRDRLEAAERLFPWLAAPDYRAILIAEGEGVTGKQIADAPTFAGVYVIKATVKVERHVLDALGAIFETRDRRAASCMPDGITDDMRRKARAEQKQSAATKMLG